MDLDHFLQNHVANSTQHQCFYHFTDRSNLESIRARHLLSMRNAKNMGVRIPAPGGNQISFDADKATNMDCFVHLAFTTSHPMAYVARQDGRIKDIVWLRIHPHIIKLPQVLITDAVSNKNGVKPMMASDIDKLDLEVIYKRTNWGDPAVNARLKNAEKYEVLVPNYVPLNYILNPNG